MMILETLKGSYQQTRIRGTEAIGAYMKALFEKDSPGCDWQQENHRSLRPVIRCNS